MLLVKSRELPCWGRVVVGSAGIHFTRLLPPPSPPSLAPYRQVIVTCAAAFPIMAGCMVSAEVRLLAVTWWLGVKHGLGLREGKDWMQRRVRHRSTRPRAKLLLCDPPAPSFPLTHHPQLGDGLNAVVGGILRGAGRQELGALLNLCSYWGLGLPSAYLLAFNAGWGLRGLWAGLAICTTVQAFVMLVVLGRFRWKREAERAAQLARETDAAELAAAELAASASSAIELACEDSAAKLDLSSHGPSTSAAVHSGSSGRQGDDVERQ